MKTLNKNLIQKKALEVRAIHHKLRQLMMELLIDADKPICVTDIFSKMKIEQSVASQHLRILKRNGFVESSKEGKYRFYNVTEKYKQYATTAA